MNKLAIIDADGLTYMSSKETLEESINILDQKIQNIFDKTEATHYVMFISKGKYFRHNVDPLYKDNRRKRPSSLKWLKTLKSYLIENYNAQSMDLVEADDLVAYWMNNPIYYGKFTNPHSHSHWMFCNQDDIKLSDEHVQIEKIMCAVDKDLLDSIPGKHFNFTYKIKDESKSKPKELLTDNDFNKGWWVETNEVDADKFKWIQVLMGDSSDGVSGLNKVGEVKATKWINECGEGYSKFVLGKYIDHYQNEAQGIFEFQKNYRLLHILDCDEDFLREIGQLPTFPTINKVEHEVDKTMETKVEF